MTEPVAEPVTEPVATEPATWRTRARAFAIDLVPGATVIAAMGMAALCFPFGGAWWWLATLIGALAFLATEANRLLLPVITGWSLGRAATGIEVVRPGDGSATSVGAVRLLLREVAHLLDSVPILLGWLWPLRDRRGRTFADMVSGTEVRAVSRRHAPNNIRSLTVGAFVGAAVLTLLAATAVYTVVYERDHKSDLTRSEISRQGPKIVADMLSYDPQSLQEDFDRAQSLATEKYRQQLIPQQDAIRDAKPVPNFYRVTDAAVLDAAPHRASMLLFLQGQRGEAGKERLISASVRVAFLQSAGRWQVDDLAVVSKPLPAEGDR
ncbi:hypothetical protein BST33_17515 [Mycolicibacter minnesotensis]|uniref:RDD domain-containing protein n=1 Tax=Mycolicibacter minnesotensis TaxID=1118379 RepID=A0AA91M3Z9_9MYCO|nr:hypothetical protein BST33_17515 [Mycolicibacter minnesotensis]